MSKIINGVASEFEIDELTIKENSRPTEEVYSWLEDKYYEHKREIERLNKELESKNKVIDTMIENEEEYCIEINNLKERIAYLERSNDRREDEILELRKENADLDNIINELEKWLEEMKEYDSGLAGTENEKWYYSNVYDYLQELKGDGSNENK